jgi:[amino group carrier protein]-L-2-aminoadipate/L-glutamate 6-kinase
VIIVKIGGGRAINLRGIASDLAALAERVIVVHGANAWRDDLAKLLGRSVTTVTSVSGHASVLSDEGALELLFMAYAGLRNTQVVQALQQAGRNAVGLTGLDGRVVQGRRNRGIRVSEGEKMRILHDLSGKPQAINRPLLEALLELGCTPVLTVPIADESGTAINSENDDVVALLGRELEPQAVLQLIEAPGLLANPADPASLIPTLSATRLAEWEAEASGRIRRKLLALSRLVEAGVPRIVVADGRSERPVADALAGRGTVLLGSPDARGVRQPLATPAEEAARNVR